MTAAPNLCIPLSLQGAQWYSIQTRYRFERKVTTQLQHKGVQTFLPLLEEFHRWSDRRQPVQVPLFSGYTFVRLDLSAGLRIELLHTEGVIGLISFRGVATDSGQANWRSAEAAIAESPVRPARFPESWAESKDSRWLPGWPGRHSGAAWGEEPCDLH
jgi:Transcription termination factor nusG